VDSCDEVVLGIVSDTHGYLDNRLLAAFQGVDAIVHAGDVGSEAVLEGLRQIAPVDAVFGNNDVSLGKFGLIEHLNLAYAGATLHVVHELPRANPPEHTSIVVFGHSHRQQAEWRDGVLYFNPGAAGRRGFHILQTAGLLRIKGGVIEPELLVLGPRQLPRR
jgi:putative phosphoesterase